MLSGVLAALVIGSIVRIIALRNSTPEVVTQRMGSLVGGSVRNGRGGIDPRRGGNSWIT
jgi:hypothetical protein